jgi:dTDP-4-dehydrorhamnose 3,5-epimerase
MKRITMQVTKTPILGLQLIEPEIKTDQRGYFMECYHQEKLAQFGIDNHFVQENQSFSTKGILRGLHYQLNPYAQAKLIRVVEGEIWDVAVDIRPGSPTFGKWEGILLSAKNKKQLLIPRGYAHGFSVIGEQATVSYKCDNFYNPEAEAGIYCLDKQLAIDWKISYPPTLSVKDQQLPSFENAIINFEYKVL